jgi:hypothetical protein
MPLKSHSVATCFGLTRPSSGNCSPIETAALHQFVCQRIPCYCISSFSIKIAWDAFATNWSSAAVSVGEQLPEDGLVRPKHVATECDFNGILK